jgi:FkbM family methyltransferase
MERENERPFKIDYRPNISRSHVQLATQQPVESKGERTTRNMTELTVISGIEMPRRIILSISSDLGTALANAWLDAGITVVGTYRTESPTLDVLRARGVALVECDLLDRASVDQAIVKLQAAVIDWDVLVVAAGTLSPVGPFIECAFDDWERSIAANLMMPLRMVQGLMRSRRRSSKLGPIVLFFAGSGTNNAVTNFSAYTLSKIACIKMVELLDAEVQDARFAILGPGWVKTKIHKAVLVAGTRAGSNFDLTKRLFESNGGVPVNRVVECCEWLIGAPRIAISGRNFSLVHDSWEKPELLELLANDQDMYKLRREGNERMVKSDNVSVEPYELLARLLKALPSLAKSHRPNTEVYTLLAKVAESAVAQLFGSKNREKHPFGPFGSVAFPYRSMGAVDSLDLFGLDELIIFSFYWANRGIYRRVADIGANIGLHSLVLSRCGYDVRSFEPDPKHVVMLNETLSMNGAKSVTVIPAAVSDRAGEAEFVRVLGNTTGSHLAGAKGNPYGDIERFRVPLVPISEVIEWADLMKIDAEGHETNIILATTRDQWNKADAMIEIGTQANAGIILEHCRRLGLKLFTQKTGWARVQTLDDLPTSYKEGSTFITQKTAMPGMDSE